MDFRLLIITFFMAVMLPSDSANAQDAVADFPVKLIANDIGKNAMSRSEIKACFMGKYNNWSNRKRVLIVLPSTKHPNVELYSQLLYGKSYYFVKKYWYSLVFQGRFEPPFFFDSDAEIMEFVRKNSGAIAVIGLEQEFDPKKVLTIE